MEGPWCLWHLVVEELSLLAVEGLSLLTFPSAALWLVGCPSTAHWLVGSSMAMEKPSLLTTEGRSLLAFPSTALWLVGCPSTALWLVGSSMHLAAGINSAPCSLALARQWRVLALGIRLASSDFAQRLETKELPLVPVAMGGGPCSGNGALAPSGNGGSWWQ